jgi:lipopolysaccharide transport system ATP-binding protein
LNLSKAYVIAHQSGRHTTLAEALVHKLRHPFRQPVQERFWALQDLSLEIKKGSVVGVIGRNGAGKSTFLKILSRITEPTSGKIDLYGRVGSLLEVGTGFHNELTGRENVYLNGQILGMRRKEIDANFDAIVDFAGVERFLDTPVKRYSSGMYVRLAFAVAAHLRSEILVVDEVLAVGDVAFQQKCLGKMRDVSEDGRTVLFVSHNMAAVAQLTKTCVLLRNGTLAAFGPSDNVLEEYARQVGETANPDVYRDGQLRRPDNALSRAVEFVSVAVANRGGATIPQGEELEVDITVKAGPSSPPAARFGFTIFRSDGTPVGTEFTDECAQISIGETATFQLSIDTRWLAPGGYHIGMSVGVGHYRTGHTDFDIILDVLHFNMLALSGEGGTVAHWPAQWGVLKFPCPDVRKMRSQIPADSVPAPV